MNSDVSSGIYLAAENEAECNVVDNNRRKYENKNKSLAVKSAAQKVAL